MLPCFRDFIVDPVARGHAFGQLPHREGVSRGRLHAVRLSARVRALPPIQFSFLKTGGDEALNALLAINFIVDELQARASPSFHSR